MSTDRQEQSDTDREIRLVDYRPPAWKVRAVALDFDIRPPRVSVRSRIELYRNPEPGAPDGPIVLDGRAADLRAVAVDDRILSPAEYKLDDTTLTLPATPDRCVVAVHTELLPEENSALMGLYRSGDAYCTQCEAEGFRRITFYPDRPDVLARFTTSIVADRDRFPVLLSNGNLVASDDVGEGRHRVVWDDPWPKPSYLFALVAGDLACVADAFRTRSGREVAIRFYVDHHNADRCGHAIASLRKAMRWDEEHYGREYDLDVYMVVAVDAFTMGAMENKGLNIFNSRYVLARPDTATDTDFEGIESVIAHEYFHNWSGNRVTCRDWFQLSLKEGFTVFRDQQFTETTASAGVKRVRDVNILRTHQFREDAGPFAHPVQPASYAEINNFYTTTIYNKGAEVVRMLHRLLGADGFRRGTDAYFSRHDGEAVTIEDFLRAMETANGIELTQFRRWYQQAGTPVVRASMEHDPAHRRCTIRLSQHCPPTPGQPHKAPFHIPVAIGALAPDGTALRLAMAGENDPGPHTRVLELTRAEQAFVFEGIDRPPVISWLRGFSAPVRLETARDDATLAFLLAHDTDPFARWEAGQQLGLRAILAWLEDPGGEAAQARTAALVRALARVLDDADADPAFAALLLTLPAQAYVAEQVTPIDPLAIDRAHTAIRRATARALAEAFAHRARVAPAGEDDARAAAGHRALRNLCLAYLAEQEDTAPEPLLVSAWETATNMTESLGALAALLRLGGAAGEAALAGFHDRWRDDTLVMDKWFALQAAAKGAGVERIDELTAHPAFDAGNPNRVRALLGTFAHANPAGLHGAGEAGYRLVADWVLRLDPINPQVAARLADALGHWRRHAPDYAEPMRAQLGRIAGTAGLSRDTGEIVRRSLSD